MLNFILCDDNLSTLERLSKMLENIFMKYSYDAEVCFTSGNFQETLDYISKNKVDVLFLDIDLKSDKSGLDLADIVRKYNKNLYIVFTSAHLEYVMVAYKYKTFDFLAKPISSSRLTDTIVRLFDDFVGMPKRYLKIDNKNTIVDENEIQYIKRDGMKLVFHSDYKDYETYSSFNKVIETLPPNFIRCHKSYIVNINLIVDVDPVVNSVYFGKDSYCEIGPKFKKNFLEVLNKYGNIK